MCRCIVHFPRDLVNMSVTLCVVGMRWTVIYLAYMVLYVMVWDTDQSASSLGGLGCCKLDVR